MLCSYARELSISGEAFSWHDFLTRLSHQYGLKNHGTKKVRKYRIARLRSPARSAFGGQNPRNVDFFRVFRTATRFSRNSLRPRDFSVAARGRAMLFEN
jgi:hypothetical protein